jgi:hypothetical protein
MGTLLNNYIAVWYGSAKNDDDFVKSVLFEALIVALSILLAVITNKLGMNYTAFLFPIFVGIAMTVFICYLRYVK